MTWPQNLLYMNNKASQCSVQRRYWTMPSVSLPEHAHNSTACNSQQAGSAPLLLSHATLSMPQRVPPFCLPAAGQLLARPLPLSFQLLGTCPTCPEVGTRIQACQFCRQEDQSGMDIRGGKVLCASHSMSRTLHAPCIQVFIGKRL